MRNMDALFAAPPAPSEPSAAALALFALAPSPPPAADAAASQAPALGTIGLEFESLAAPVPGEGSARGASLAMCGALMAHCALRERIDKSAEELRFEDLAAVAASSSPDPSCAAERQWRKAADAGDADARFRLGCCYADAELGARRNVAEAARLWRGACARGHPEAAFRLGLLYRYGLVATDENSEAEAARLFRDAVLASST